MSFQWQPLPPPAPTGVSFALTTKLNSKLPFLQAPQTFPCTFLSHHTSAPLSSSPPHAFSPQSTCVSPHAPEPTGPHQGGREESWGKQPQQPAWHVPILCSTALCPAAPGRAARAEEGTREEAVALLAATVTWRLFPPKAVSGVSGTGGRGDGCVEHPCGAA